MSDVVSQRPDPEDLSVYVRRGHASGVERRALARALERDTSLRVAHQLGLDLDQDSSVQAGDEQLIARAADAALAHAKADADVASEAVGVSPRRKMRVLRFATWQLVASMVAVFALSFSGVSAALWVASVVPWGKPEDASVAPAPKPARRARPKPQLAPLAEPAEHDVVPPAPLQLEALEALHNVTEMPAHRASSASSTSSASSASSRRSDARAHDARALFHAANAARRAGDLSRAKHLYAELIAHAPRSDEAQLAHVSLGKLLLAQDQAAAAEREFQRYLASGGGPLSEEALFGRAQSLLRLGRAQAERAAWRALLAAFPESVYAAQAKQRLGVLEL